MRFIKSKKGKITLGASIVAFILACAFSVLILNELGLIKAASGDWTKERELSYTDWLYDIEYSPDGKYVAHAGADQLVYVYNATDYSLVKNITAVKNYQYDLDWSNDSQYLAVGSRSSDVYVFNTTDWSSVVNLTSGSTWVYSVSFSPQGEIAYISGDDFYVHNTSNWNQIYHSAIAEYLNKGANFDHAGDYWAYGGGDSVVYVYESQPWNNVKNISTSADIRSIAWKKDDSVLAAGLDNGMIELYNSTDWSELSASPLTKPSDVGGTAWVNDMSFSSSGKWLGAASYNNNFYQWDIEAGWSLDTYVGTDTTARGCDFSPDVDHFGVSMFEKSSIFRTPGYTAPNQPTLNNPNDGETGVSTSPILNVTYSDPDGDTGNVSFYWDFEHDWYYQEFTNITDNDSGQTADDQDPPLDTDKGLINYSGSYGIEGIWVGYEDGDWRDGGWQTDQTNYINIEDGETGFLWMNYSKPEEFSSAKWKILDAVDGNYNKKNLTLPSGCLNNEKMRLRVWGHSPSSGTYYNNWSCYDGNNWVVLRSISGGYGTEIVEEAIWWDLKKEIGNVTNLANNSKATYEWIGLDNNQTYEWFVNVTDGELATLSDTWNFTTEVTEADCICPGTGSNWKVNMSNYCVISSDCDLGNGNLTFVDSGNFTVNATINTSNMEFPSTGQTVYMKGPEGFIT